MQEKLERTKRISIDAKTGESQLISPLGWEHCDDHIDEEEECGGANRAMRFSIKCLESQKMLPASGVSVEKDLLNKTGSSMLSRASRVISSSKDNVARISSSKSLESTMNACISNVDEREEQEKGILARVESYNPAKPTCGSPSPGSGHKQLAFNRQVQKKIDQPVSQEDESGESQVLEIVK